MSDPDGIETAALARRVGGELEGDGARRIRGLASPARAAPDQLAFVVRADALPDGLADSRAGALLIPADLPAAVLPAGAVRIRVAAVYPAYARVSQMLAATRRAREPGIAPSAVVDPSARVDPAATVAAGAVVGAGARLESGAVVEAQAHVGRDAVIGAGSFLHPGVRVLDGVVLGERCLVHAGTVIGADGFGFAPEDGTWLKIEQLGGVRVGDDVEIGANCTIDRGAVEDTRIGHGVKIDNLVHVAHNVEIGDHTAIAGCVGIAGSARIGRHCAIGGGAGILGHLSIADHVTIHAMTLVTRSIEQAGHYASGVPHQEARLWNRTLARLRRLGRRARDT
ncbi:UDP-3-O-(3-hydroxymyristoyl)glucosamine N-acyltransferase [Thioalkalivibrio sp. ALE23]|uniref:UDP-3-O-(3-hydroxymyristoyl)glucosamine N-acyltransferase n=1 Tax=Thioalkalivibrio sp. ALE23 TaxID=1265495 RepID=UPI0003713563|nr:UDP-3-O-(3-hydroxymyristoyl)glucosamine N-acyltransferase [Thioalkalivibrio sp. ALE23]